MMKKIAALLMVAILAAGALIGCASAPAASTPTSADTAVAAPAAAAAAPVDSSEVRTIKAVSMMGATQPIWHWVQAYCKLVEKYSGGRMVIDCIGGDEVIPEEDQVSSVKAGIVDICFDVETLSQTVPLYQAMSVTNMTSWEEREAGLYELYDEVYTREGGVKWLGKFSQPQMWVLSSNKEIPTLESINGMLIRCNQPLVPVVEALGGTPAVIPYDEIYTAMERGTIDGFLACPENYMTFGFQEVSKYVVTNLRLLYGGMSGVIMNLDVWNSLTPEEQSWLQEPLKDFERSLYSMCYYNQLSGLDAMLEYGMTGITWSSEDVDTVIARQRQGMWDSIKGNVQEADARKFAEIVGLTY